MTPALMNTPNSVKDLFQNQFKPFKGINPGQLKKSFGPHPGLARGQGQRSQKGVLSPEKMRQQQSFAPQGGLPDLLNDFGLDKLELSPGTAFSMEYAKAQFEVNYHSIQSINTATGIQTQEMSFSFTASFEYLSVQAGQGVQNPFAPTEEGAVDPMEKLMEYFSPEKTAERILDFALSFFPASSHHEEGGDTEDSRQKYADFMGGAIQNGFDQAQNVLGVLPEEVQGDIDQTHENVFDGLREFVKNGLPAAKEGVYASIQQTQIELNMEIRIEEEERAMTERHHPTADPHPHVDLAV